MMSRLLKVSVISASVLSLTACSFAQKYTDSEKEIISSMTPSKYQPATRQMRSTIETQDLLAQAAFWSREYELNPADLEAAVKLAASVRKMGNASRAAEIAQTTRAMYPNDPYLIAEHSAALIALERGSEAVKPLDTALRAAPGYARLWSLKGAALDQLGKYDVARQHYNRALQITPNDPNIMANMGLSFALAGDPTTAESWLRRAANHPQAGKGIQQNLDLVLQLQGKSPQFAGTTQQPAARAVPPRRAQSSAQRRAPQQSYPQYQAPAVGGAPMIGHRSNTTVVGSQAGAPGSAAEMARSIANQSGQNRVVVPHQPKPAVQSGNILEQIAGSVNRKAAGGQTTIPQVPVQQLRTRPQAQQNPYAPRAPQTGYPAPQQQPARRGAARRR